MKLTPTIICREAIRLLHARLEKPDLGKFIVHRFNKEDGITGVVSVTKEIEEKHLDLSLLVFSHFVLMPVVESLYISLPYKPLFMELEARGSDSAVECYSDIKLGCYIHYDITTSIHFLHLLCNVERAN